MNRARTVNSAPACRRPSQIAQQRAQIGGKRRDEMQRRAGDGCASASSAACSAWRGKLRAGPRAGALGLRSRRAHRRAPDDPSPRGARGSGACAPSRAPVEEARERRSARARCSACAPRAASELRIDMRLALVRVAADRPLERSRGCCAAHRARSPRSLSGLAGRGTRATAPAARARGARPAGRPTCPCRAGARCPGRSAERSCGTRAGDGGARSPTVPRHAPGAGCTTMPAGLSMASRSVVLVEHVERKVFRLDASRARGRRFRHLDRLPAARARYPPCAPLPSTRTSAGVDPALHLRARESRAARHENDVEPRLAGERAAPSACSGSFRPSRPRGRARHPRESARRAPARRRRISSRRAAARRTRPVAPGRRDPRRNRTGGPRACGARPCPNVGLRPTLATPSRRSPPHSTAHRVDAVRHQHGGPRAHVGRRKAERLAAAVADDHAALDRIALVRAAATPSTTSPAASRLAHRACCSPRFHRPSPARPPRPRSRVSRPRPRAWRRCRRDRARSSRCGR